MCWLQSSMSESYIVELQHSITHLLQDKSELAPIYLLRHILLQIHIIWLILESYMLRCSVSSDEWNHMFELELAREISDIILIQQVDLEMLVIKH
jgi:hypothetical protein